MMLVFCFVHQRSYAAAVLDCSIHDNKTMSAETVADYYLYCREVCVAGLIQQSYSQLITYSTLNNNGQSFIEVQGKIRGLNHVVQVDETKFCRRKYERGRLVEGTWIFGMIDNETNELRIHVCKDDKRDENTLTDMLLKYVEVGTTIVSDMWAGYENVHKYGYNHV